MEDSKHSLGLSSGTPDCRGELRWNLLDVIGGFEVLRRAELRNHGPMAGDSRTGALRSGGVESANAARTVRRCTP